MLSATKYKNIFLSPTPEARDRLIAKLSEDEAKELLRLLMDQLRQYQDLGEK